MKDQCKNVLPLHDFFWKEVFDWRDAAKGFPERNYKLMEKAGALSKEGEDEELDLDLYDKFITGHLEKLQTTALAEATEDTVRQYCENAEDFLTERLEFISTLGYDSFLVLRGDEDNGLDEESIECFEEMLCDNRRYLEYSTAVCEKLLGHYARAHELNIKFGNAYLENAKQKSATHGAIEGPQPGS